MSQSLARIWLHVVFSTKERRALFQHEGFRDEMCHMIGHHVNEAGCTAIRAGGWIDHVHFVCGLSRTVNVAALVEQVKVETSKWAKKATHGSSTFSWQLGYGAFSVSQSNLASVVEYINNQAAHHKQQSFQDEFRELCRRHELEIDERSVWDGTAGPLGLGIDFWGHVPGPVGRAGRTAGPLVRKTIDLQS